MLILGHVEIAKARSKIFKIIFIEILFCNKCISSSVMYLKGVCTFFTQGPKMIQIVKRL